MRIKRALTAFLLSLVAAGAAMPSLASDAGAGTVTSVLILDSGVVLFTHSGSRTALPACGQGLPTRWAFNGATAQGQAKLALLLTAYSTGKRIGIVGYGSCAVHGDTETTNYFYTID